MYFKARYFETGMGRFISRDPAQYREMRMNLYAAYFVPNKMDPTGEIPVAAAIVIANSACVASSGASCANQAIKAGAGTDKWKHCFCSCEISRMCGLVGAGLAGLGREVWQEIAHHLGKHPHGWEWRDVVANGTGLACSGSIGIPIIPKLVEWCGLTPGCCECCNTQLGEGVPCP